ncbi:hypothetical protein QFC19_004025 [Naganishia cerealis]|uniref:Uncharacterized protein n=1 Tax=Naganishia cerealis TaxID=610337 RepID=A0ACC2VYQ0_9TREE|nr:hypothetical protein QFC19_004025 [Naganishia cerealis]
MSQQSCTAFCASKGMPLAGVEYSSECYCGYSMSNGASNTTLLASSKCAMPCSDKTYSESCGGAGTLSLFENTALYPTVTLPTGWTYDNCRTEASSGRGLTGYSFTSDSMTLETCLKTCDSKGFAIGKLPSNSGVEYGRECYCSNAWSNNAGSITTGCNMPCGGAGYETCGAGSKLSTYVKASSTAPRRRGIAGRILVA